MTRHRHPPGRPWPGPGWEDPRGMPPYGRPHPRPQGQGQGHGDQGFSGQGRYAYRGPQIPSPWLLVPLVLMVAGAGGMVASILAVALLTMVPVLVVAGTGLAMHYASRRGTVHAAPRPVVPPPLVTTPSWRNARARFDRLRERYATYECDPMAVLRLPALADVSVPSTARFVDAFAEAQALCTDARPGDRHARDFVAAVERAERCWEAARDAAERIRHSNLSDAERSSVERAIKLLTTARDSDSEAERLAAYSLARSELARLEKAGVLHLPRAATAALESLRPALPE